LIPTATSVFASSPTAAPAACSAKKAIRLCIHHAREEQQRLESEKLAAEFASLSGKLNTVTDINHVLGKVFTALAEKRISHQTADTFGYLGQLLLQSIPAVKNEINAAVRHPGAYDAMVRDSLPFVRRFRKQ
jgi:hypothetical protein